jgi:hypothetical protein
MSQQAVKKGILNAGDMVPRFMKEQRELCNTLLNEQLFEYIREDHHRHRNYTPSHLLTFTPPPFPLKTHARDSTQKCTLAMGSLIQTLGNSRHPARCISITRLIERLRYIRYFGTPCKTLQGGKMTLEMVKAYENPSRVVLITTFETIGNHHSPTKVCFVRIFGLLVIDEAHRARNLITA